MRVRSGGPVNPAPAMSPSSRPAGAGRPRPFTAVLGEQGQRPGPPDVAQPRPRAPGAHRSPRPDTPRPALVATPAAPVRALLERTLSSETRVDTLLAAAARGKTFSPGELLALQTSVFRYSQAVEVVSRATDKLVGAVKQTMGTQV